MAFGGADSGSFRDPSGQVYVRDNRVFRTVMPRAARDFDYVRSTGLVDRLVDEGRLIPETIIEKEILGEAAAHASYVIEHPRLPFVSYPYEWSFTALKSAALHHLDLHLSALEHEVTLSDATAYNVQFLGAKPVFIDSLSFRKYVDGEFWLGHRQFCEQFLNPLLLRAVAGIPHNTWLRGEIEGISAEALCRILPPLQKVSPRIFMHVVLQARFQRRSHSQDRAAGVVSNRRLPRTAFTQMLAGLRKWITRLEPAGSGATVWGSYTSHNSYSTEEAGLKRKFVSEFARTLPQATLWDVGCNTGDYAESALAKGVGRVIGFDFDQDAVDLAFSRARENDLDFLPLLMNCANPSPNQGWAQAERQGMNERAGADGLLALALIHHLVISANIPLFDAVRWLIGLAPTGIIEFVPKSDPMVQKLLQLREDIFDDYNEENFVSAMEAHVSVVRKERISTHGRTLYWYSHPGQ